MWELEDEKKDPKGPVKPDPRGEPSQEPGSAPTPQSVPALPEEPIPSSSPEHLEEIKAAVTEALMPVVSMLAEVAKSNAQELKQHTASLQKFSETLQDLGDVKAIWSEARSAADWLKRQRETHKAETEDLKHQLREAREAVSRAGKEATGKARAWLIAALILCALSSTTSALIAWSLAGKAQEKAAEPAPSKDLPERPPSSKKR